MKKTTYAFAAWAALGASAGPALAVELTASTWLPQGYPHSIHAYQDMFQRIGEKTNGDIKTEVFYSGSLLPARTALTGIGDGAADVGYVYAGYTPAELPIQTFLNDTSFVSDDMWTVALAYTEYNYTNAAAIAEWDKHNIVFAGGHATPVYNMLCNTEVSTVDQAKGKRMRTAGASFTGLVESLGGSPVSVPIGDAYSGLQRGSLECVIAAPDNLVSYSLNEVVKNVTTVPLGVVTGAVWAFNKDSWNSLTDAQKALLKDEMAVGFVRTHLEFDRGITKALEDAKAKNIALNDAGADLQAHIDAYKAKFVDDLAAATQGFDGKAVYAEFAALQAEWAKRLEGVDRTDEAALVAIVKEHLMSKLAL